MLENIRIIKKDKEENEILAQIVVLEKEIFSESSYSETQLLEMKKSENYDIFVCMEKKDVLGYLIIYDNLDSYEIMKIGVKIGERKRGIGKILLKYLKKSINRNIFLEVRESNLPAIEFYKKNGFTQVGKRKNYYSNNGENALIMQLEI